MKETDAFYINQEEPNKSCFLAMRELLFNCDARISETPKYGMPCFTLNKKPFCYLWVNKKSSQPYFLFVDGDKLKHPALREDGRKKMKVFIVNPTRDLDLNQIKAVLEEALALHS